jgi:flagellar M-ring protein FliF
LDLQTIFARLKVIGENFTAGQIVSLVVSFVLVVGVVGGSALWLNTPSYALLFADMDEDAAGQVVTRLKSMKVPYSLDEGGRAIRVPATRVDELRLDLTAQGLPSSGRVGFEIFDRTAFGATEFLEKVNYRRALEGEIARTISTIAEVGGARVHIAMGKDTLFGEPRPAKASVVLKLRDSRGLPPSAVAGISNLVAASVEGLRPEAVVILDSMGRPLSQPTDGGDEAGGAAQMERQQRLETDMSTRLIALLEPVVGDGRVRVNVALKLNPRSRELTEERWDPNTVIRSRQTSADVANMAGAATNSVTQSPPVAGTGGVAGARGNLPAPPASAAAAPATATSVTPSGSSRNTETTNYEVSKTTSHTVEPPGDVARVSVAVLIDDNREMKTEPDGKTSVNRVPRTPEELQKLFALVSAAVGVDETRGDQVTVQNVPFDEPVLEEPPPPTFWTRYQSPIQEGSKITSVLILGLVAIFFVIRPMMRRTTAIAPRLAPALAGAVASGGPTALVEQRPKTVAELESEIEAQMDAAAGKAGDNRRLPVLTRRAAAIAQKEPENTAKLLRSWMAE